MENNILEILQLLPIQPQTLHQLQSQTTLPIETLKIILDELHRNNVIQNILISEDMYYYPTHVTENYNTEMNEEEINQIMQLHFEILQLQKEIEINERNGKESLNKVHEYNDIKDIGQMLIGKLGQLENKTIMELYEEYNIDLND